MYAAVENSPGSTVPAFLMKLWTLVEDSSTDHLIKWDPSGTSFHVYDQQSFSREILPMYFKHNNIASFIRQLNMYGFRKVAHIEQGGLKIEKDDLQFQHQYFQKRDRDLLQFIKRKVSNQVVKTEPLAPVSSDEISRVLTDVNQVKTKQDDMEQNLDYIKRENKLLWREVATLRQKHHKQQQIMNKLVQFLVSLVSTNRAGGLTIPPIKRMPLAISDVSQLAPSPPPSSTLNGNNIQNSIIQETVVKTEPKNVMLNNIGQLDTMSPDQYSVESPKSDMFLQSPPSGAGPIIRELTDSPQKAYLVPASLLSPSSLAEANNSIILGSDNTKYVVVPTSAPNTVTLAPAGDNLSGDNFLLSPKIEAAPSLEDAYHLGLNAPTGSTMASAPSPIIISPPPPLAGPHKRKRKQAGLDLQLSPSKRLQGTTLKTPTPQPMSPSTSLLALDQLTNDNFTLGKETIVESVPRTGTNLTLAPSKEKDDIAVSSDQLDMLTSDLDGLKNILQDQYKFDPSFLMDLFDSTNPWPMLTEKDLDNLQVETDKQEAGTSSDGNITGTELVEYNPRDELFPELMEGTLMADIDDID